MTKIRMTYTGSCKYGDKLWCNNMSAKFDSSPKFYDHIMGLKDSLSHGAKKEGSGTTTQKRVFRYSPGVGRATLSGVVPEDWIPELMSHAINGTKGDAELRYFNMGDGQTVKDAVVASLTVSANAGDVVSFNAELIGKDVTASAGDNAVTCSKLLDWTRFKVQVSGVSLPVSSFSITINNNPIPIFTAANWDKPLAIRIGMQEVTGTISFYGTASLWGDGHSTDPTSLTFGSSKKTYTLDVAFTPPSGQADTGPYVTTVSFTGAKDGVLWS